MLACPSRRASCTLDPARSPTFSKTSRSQYAFIGCATSAPQVRVPSFAHMPLKASHRLLELVWSTAGLNHPALLSKLARPIPALDRGARWPACPASWLVLFVSLARWSGRRILVIIGGEGSRDAYANAISVERWFAMGRAQFAGGVGCLAPPSIVALSSQVPVTRLKIRDSTFS